MIGLYTTTQLNKYFITQESHEHPCSSAKCAFNNTLHKTVFKVVMIFLNRQISKA